jgi:hypothetical protein
MGFESKNSRTAVSVVKADDLKNGRTPAEAVAHNVNGGIFPGDKIAVYPNHPIFVHLPTSLN